MNDKREGLNLARFVRNGLPNGYVVRLDNMEERHFPTATRVKEGSDGSIELYFDRIFLGSFEKSQHKSFWPVYAERPKARKSR